MELNAHLFSTEMFFESVDDAFIDVNSEDWTFDPANELVPIILPRAYLDLYNFGYAPTSSFPAISEGLVNNIIIDLELGDAPKSIQRKGRVVGFSSRLNTILVPQSFMDWSNNLLAPNSQADASSRIIVQVTNPTDERIAAYFEAHDMKVEGDKLDASKAGWFVRLLIVGVMLIGLVICILACYVLILSIFRLMQRNHEAIRNLRAIGYTVRKVSLPYQLIVLITNAVSVLSAMGLLMLVRNFYLNYLTDLAPDYAPASLLIAWLFVIGIGLVLTAINAVLIHRSIKKTC